MHENNLETHKGRRDHVPFFPGGVLGLGSDAVSKVGAGSTVVLGVKSIFPGWVARLIFWTSTLTSSCQCYTAHFQGNRAECVPPGDLPRALGLGGFNLQYRHVTRVDAISYHCTPPAILVNFFLPTPPVQWWRLYRPGWRCPRHRQAFWPLLVSVN